MYVVVVNKERGGECECRRGRYRHTYTHTHAHTPLIIHMHGFEKIVRHWRGKVRVVIESHDVLLCKSFLCQQICGYKRVEAAHVPVPEARLALLCFGLLSHSLSVSRRHCHGKVQNMLHEMNLHLWQALCVHRMQGMPYKLLVFCPEIVVEYHHWVLWIGRHKVHVEQLR